MGIIHTNNNVPARGTDTQGAASEALHACPYCAHPLSTPPGALPQLVGCLACRNAVLFAEPDSPPQAAPGVPDVRTDIEPGGVVHRLLEATPGRLASLPALPGVFEQVLALIHDPISEMDDIVHAVERDSALTLHLLKAANSAAFHAERHIDDARAACVRLGMKEVANVVWRVQCAGAFRSPRADLKGTMTDLWTMSVAAGFCTREVARARRLPDPEMAFLTGLTHAVGQTLLLQILADEHDFAIQRLSKEEDLYRKILHRLCPLMSLLVLQHWGLPPAVRTSALYQRAPHLAPAPDARRLTHGLVLGIELARLCGYTPDTVGAGGKVKMSCIALEVTPGQLSEMAEVVQGNLEDFAGAMALG